MKRIFLSAAAFLAFAGGASAQTYSSTGGSVAVQNRIANLDERFEAGSRAGVFSAGQRNALARQLAELRNLEQRYSYDGLSPAEGRVLQQRIRIVRDQMRAAGGSNWARNYGWSDAELDRYAGAYGSDDAYAEYRQPYPNRGVTYDRYGRPVATDEVLYDRYGRPVANSGTRYDQYGRPVARSGVEYDRYGRATSNGGYYGQGGPYEPIPQSNRGGNVLGSVLGNVMGGGGGMGGILGSILGRGGLRTGDVITSTIGSVLGGAAGYGRQFRDSNNVYYRSDGERVYQIDARTNRVVAVHPVRR